MELNSRKLDRTNIKGALRRLHMGPGDHPSGSSQQVHAGDEGYAVTSFRNEQAALQKFIEGTWPYMRRATQTAGWMDIKGNLYQMSEETHWAGALWAFEQSGVWDEETVRAVKEIGWRERSPVKELIQYGFIRIRPHRGSGTLVFQIIDFEEISRDQRDRMALEIQLAIDSGWSNIQVQPDSIKMGIPDAYYTEEVREILGLTTRHYGPGPHPGTGTSQDVHGDGSVSVDQIKFWADHDRELSHEMGRLFLDGEQALVQWGTEDRIEYSEQDVFAIRELVDEAKEHGQYVIFTHNHPGGTFAGDGNTDIPPSFDDCHFAMMFDFDEWHVVTPNGKWVVKKGDIDIVGRYYNNFHVSYFLSNWNKWALDNASNYFDAATLAKQQGASQKAKYDPEFAKIFVRFKIDRIEAMEEITKLFDFEWVPNE